MIKDQSLVALFEQFIKETINGKRRKQIGERIKIQSTKNYEIIKNYLLDYEAHHQSKLRIRTGIRNNRKQIIGEKNYWKKFYRQFSDFLFRRGCHDNFVGSIFKILKCFFRYLKNEKYLMLQECFETFYIRREDIRIISLVPQQYCFLILDEKFNLSLRPHLRKTKQMFVFGCAVALRYSDLFGLCVKDVEFICGEYFLVFRSIKTGTPVNVKLPGFAVEIYQKFSRRKGPRQSLFPRISLNQFNNNIKKIGELAGWSERIGKYRGINGKAVEIQNKNHQLYRYCDLLSSHTMRKTGITVMLMLGMPEYLVRKISGHAPHSQAFYRYVNVAQSHVTDEMDKMHAKLLSLYNMADKNT